jgi:hypothetical protein
MKPRRDARGRFMASIQCDPAHPFVLVGEDGMPVERFARRLDALERRKECGGRVIDTRRRP